MSMKRTNLNISNILREYRTIWFLGFKTDLMSLTPSQIKKLPETHQKEFLAKWDKAVWNKNRQEKYQKLLNIRDLPKKVELDLPEWIMDRLKEGLDQYVRGEWLSSISLCGVIVEFLAQSLELVYSNKIPQGDKT